MYILSTSLGITAHPQGCNIWIQFPALFEEVWSHTDTCNATCNSLFELKNAEVKEKKPVHVK